MATVIIVGILAMLAAYGVRKYIGSSKTGEAIELIGAIKAAQENYKDETFSYLDVTGALETYYPVNAAPGQTKVQWGGAHASLANWQTLGIAPAGPVIFVYSCTAGLAANAVPTPIGITIGNWPTTQPGPWYVVKAKADLGNGDVVFVSSSFSGEIFAQNN